MELTVVELFAGVGGFRVGLNHIQDIDANGRAIENGDWRFVWANQFEPAKKVQHAFDCYTTRFGSENHSNEDIHLVEKSTIPNHSLLVGGFPCQDYSVARSLANEQGIEGKKGVLFWDIKDILVAKKPPFVLLENVDRLLKSPASRRGRDFAVMLKTFDELGYGVQWRVLNAGEYGMPQKRKRVFIFAYLKSTKYANAVSSDELTTCLFNIAFPLQEIGALAKTDLNAYEDILAVSNCFSEGKFFDSGIMNNGRVVHADVLAKGEPIYSLGEILQNAAQLYNEDMNVYIVANDRLDKWKYLKGSKRIERRTRSGHVYIYSEGKMAFPENLDAPARTMLTSEGTQNRSSHIIFDERINRYRILRPVECEMIQMFPPNWTDTMPAKTRYFVMGNALVTGIVSRLEPLLKRIILNED